MPLIGSKFQLSSLLTCIEVAHMKAYTQKSCEVHLVISTLLLVSEGTSAIRLKWPRSSAELDDN